MTDTDLLELMDVIDAVRTMLDHIGSEIPERYSEEYASAYSALTHVSDRMYRDVTGDRTIEEIHGGA